MYVCLDYIMLKGRVFMDARGKRSLYYSVIWT